MECMGPIQPTGSTTIGSPTSATVTALLEGAAAGDGVAAGDIPPSYPHAGDEQLPSPTTSAWAMNEEVGERGTAWICNVYIYMRRCVELSCKPACAWTSCDDSAAKPCLRSLPPSLPPPHQPPRGLQLFLDPRGRTWAPHLRSHRIYTDDLAFSARPVCRAVGNAASVATAARASSRQTAYQKRRSSSWAEVDSNDCVAPLIPNADKEAPFSPSPAPAPAAAAAAAAAAGRQRMMFAVLPCSDAAQAIITVQLHGRLRGGGGGVGGGSYSSLSERSESGGGSTGGGSQPRQCRIEADVRGRSVPLSVILPPSPLSRGETTGPPGAAAAAANTLHLELPDNDGGGGGGGSGGGGGGGSVASSTTWECSDSDSSRFKFGGSRRLRNGSRHSPPPPLQTLLAAAAAPPPLGDPVTLLIDLQLSLGGGPGRIRLNAWDDKRLLGRGSVLLLPPG